MKNELSQKNGRNSSKKKQWIKVAPLVMCGMMGATFLGESSAFAHGFVQNSRAHMGNTHELGQLSWTEASNKYGRAVNEPQSIEAPKGFPLAGPADGRIASGNVSGFEQLDMQSPLLWKKMDMKTGQNNFVWKYAAEHRTAKWSYYITKQGWDMSKPLTRDALEPIGEVNGYEQLPQNHPDGKGYIHQINIPADRSGYHVILGVWDIADTANAFYQVMDVNVQNDGGEDDTEAPSIPTSLQAKAGTTKVNLEWTASTDNVGVSHYNVYRNGEKLPQPVNGLTFEDVNLEADTEYMYQVSAVDRSGNESEKSAPIQVKTNELPADDTEAPTAPTGLHSMGETESTVDLMWKAATDNVAVDHYEIYRDGERVHANVTGTMLMDTGLQPNTNYTYQVKAVDAAGNVSEASNTLNIQTEEKSEEGLSTWDAYGAYKKGDRVLYEGKVYEAIQDYQGHGDTSWITAPALWKLV